MPLELYESDDAIMNRSPQLRPTVVNYQPHEDVPPFLLQSRAWGDGKTNSPPSSAHSRRSSSDFRRHIRRAEPSLGDAVLLTTLAPNRPDIARQALERPLEPILAVDEEIDQSRFDSQRQQRKPSQDSSIRPVGTTSIPDASQNRKPFPTQSSSSPPDREPLLPPFNQLVGSVPAPRKQSLPSHGNHYPPPPPPMIQSPPHSSTASPPENKQSLPPLQTALAGLNHQLKSPFPVSGSSSVSSHSVGDGRKRQPSITLPPPPVPSQAPTPISYHSSPISGPDASGPSPVSQQPIHARSAIDKPDPQSPPKMSPSSPLTNYPTPIEPTIRSADERPGAAPQGNIYKCPFPGCTARAFQTQYLLNSHANVHSQDRPHFCPVEGCPRGIGGKGFKRKNEMIRHGLVHDSPGYVCPFCKDQRHKYPRPDNLQRHVRLHHKDKSRDDPELRAVLARRPKGSRRGRRRRSTP